MPKSKRLFFIWLILVVPALPQQNPDFSGSYVLKSVNRSDSSRTMNPEQIPVGQQTLKITQGANWIEIASTLVSGRTNIRRYNLDGSDSVNIELDGTSTTEQAKLKGKTLTIRSKTKVPSGPLKGTTTYATSRWEWSRDLKTLSVHSQLQPEGIHMVGDTFTTIYVRQ